MRACERVLTAVLVVATGATASPGDGAKHSVSASVSAKAPAIDLLAQVVAASGAVAATLPPQPSSRSAPTLAANAGNAGIANANANANGASNAGQGSPLQSLWSALQSASPCLISCFPSLQGILTNAAIGDQICYNVPNLDSCAQKCQEQALLAELVDACQAQGSALNAVTLATAAPYVRVPTLSGEARLSLAANCIALLLTFIFF